MVAGFLQMVTTGGSTQTIRIEQIFGFISIVLLYLAMLASPLTKAYPDLSINQWYLHARRAVGVSAFYYASLHVYLTFFGQLGGFAGVQYYNEKYAIAILCGVVTLAVLLVMSATSLDRVVKLMGFRNWKLLQRLVYLAGVLVIVHVAILGTHYAGLGLISTLSIVALSLLLWLECQRFRGVIERSKQSDV